MLLSVSSYSFSAYVKESGADYAALCHLAKEIGFSGIEFTDLAPEKAGARSEEEAALRVREACEKQGLATVAYTVGANFQTAEPEKEAERLCRKADIAALLGAGLMRHDAAFSLKTQPRYTWEDGIRDMAPFIRQVAAYAEKKGIRTMTENHGYIYQDPERVKALILAVNHPNFGWLFDIGNFSVADRSATEALGHAAPYIFHVHAKDMLLKKGNILPPSGFFRSRGGNFWRGTVLGHGSVPVAETLLALKQTGYNGAVTLEFEGPEDCLSALRWGYEYLSRLDL